MRTWQLLLLSGCAAVVVLTLISLGVFSSREVAANPLGGLAAISAGEDHTCALTESGTVKCWGRRGLLPSDVVDLGAPAVALGSGTEQQCAILEGGSVRCWGFGPQTTPALPGPALAIDGGTYHMCAVIEGGTVSCWGTNSFGQLAIPDEYCTYWTPCVHSPTTVAGVSDAVAVTAGGQHTCVVLSTGGVTCWGQNQAGQLGDGTGVDRAAPGAVHDITDAVAVAGGSSHTCALTSGGGVKCWGNGYRNTPIDVQGLESGVVMITASQSHTCVLMASGGAKCWGDNAFGQLGDGQRCGVAFCPAAVDVEGLQEGVTGLSAGTFHTCAVMNTGTAKCWGVNSSGQLGNGEARFFWHSSVPLDVVALDAKPTPPPTPCGLGGCPTATPRPAPPKTGIDFSISIDSDDDGIAECGTAEGELPYCEIELDSEFRVIVELHALSPSTSEYAGYDAIVGFSGVSSKHKSDSIWPDCGFPATFYGSDFLSFGCAAPVGDVTSSYVGVMGQSLFTCTHSGSVTLRHGFGNTSVVPRSLYTEYEAATGGEMLPVTCGEPTDGDVDCSAFVNSIDAQLMLQRDAALLDALVCAHLSDVNLDRATNAVDALITQQYIAGLVGGLPVMP